jgi:hypothetical protein
MRGVRNMKMGDRQDSNQPAGRQARDPQDGCANLMRILNIRFAYEAEPAELRVLLRDFW